MDNSFQVLAILLQCLLTRSKLVPEPGFKLNRLQTSTKIPITPLTPRTPRPEIADPKVRAREVGHFFDPLTKGNSEFCTSMATEPMDYPITPWWYRYCSELMRNKKHKLKDKVDLDSIKKYMKDEMLAYKKYDDMESRRMFKQNEKAREKAKTKAKKAKNKVG